MPLSHMDTPSRMFTHTNSVSMYLPWLKCALHVSQVVLDSCPWRFMDFAMTLDMVGGRGGGVSLTLFYFLKAHTRFQNLIVKKVQKG